jgi:hypothetical protein
MSLTRTDGRTGTLVAWGQGYRNDWDGRDDVGAAQSWHEAASGYCSDCGERWLTEQLTGGNCPDCCADKNNLQWACVLELRRLRLAAVDAEMRAMREADPLVLRCRELNR